eukprot:Em0006g1157a
MQCQSNGEIQLDVIDPLVVPSHLEFIETAEPEVSEILTRKLILFYGRGGLVLAMGAMRVVVAAARVAAGKVVVGALVPILVPVVGLVQVAAVLLLLLLEVGAALLLAVGQRWGQLCSAGAVLQLLLAADSRGAAMYLAAVAA